MDTIYAKNYRIANTPQVASNLGFFYRSRNYWYIGISGNYFDEIWAGINPIRLTSEAVSNVLYHSSAWYDIIRQQRLPSEMTIDFSGGYSWKLPAYLLNKNTFLVLGFHINNLTNNKNLLVSGGQQLRFDAVSPNSFPSKYGYANGMTFSTNVTFRF